MILIVGANGVLGRETARLLLSQGPQVRLLARMPAKVHDLRQMGAEIIDSAFPETFDSAALLAEFPKHLTTLEEFIEKRDTEKKQLSA